MAADWVIRLDPSTSAGRLSPALLGQYDLSGALFHYDQVPGLGPALKAAGLGEWRVGVGRWEFMTQLLPTLTEGPNPDCTSELRLVPAQAWAAQGLFDLDLIRARDWFTYTPGGQPVTEAMTRDDSRYSLAYVRSVIDVAARMDLSPYVDIDLMPRALAANQTPTRSRTIIPDACTTSFTNAVSNTRPASPQVFAAAVQGMVQRVVEGSGSEPGRPVVYWEVWNEPELRYFWDGTMADYGAMAVSTLVRLDAYRRASASPAAKALKFGLGSFARASTAVGVLSALDTSPLQPGVFVPVDFLSFHSYNDDPLAIVADIRQVALARNASAHYRSLELGLTEWGPELTGSRVDFTSMDAPLHAATVIALGASAGLDRAHHTIFWDFYGNSVVSFGLLDHEVRPKPLYHAYALLAPVIAGGAERLAPMGLPDGALEGGTGAVLASRDALGTVRVLLINRAAAPRTARVEWNGASAVPTRVATFEDPRLGPRASTPSPLVVVPARSLVLFEF